MKSHNMTAMDKNSMFSSGSETYLY